MKILLIGATGQIGFALAQRLSRSEHQLSVLVRSNSELEFEPNVRVIQSKCFDRAVFSSALESQDAVISFGVSAGLHDQGR